MVFIDFNFEDRFILKSLVTICLMKLYFIYIVSFYNVKFFVLLKNKRYFNALQFFVSDENNVESNNYYVNTNQNV